ncbi:MAG: hypothetical protein Q7R97_05210 [Candidatus Daviesbacteria bacterium]|nr:hypothetical protein [Candidatus Daviesbacteria bacterium]
MATHKGVSEDTKVLVTVLLLLFAYPAGVIVMWYWTNWPRWIKIVVGLPLILLISFIIILFIAMILGFGFKLGDWANKGKVQPYGSTIQLITPAPLDKTNKLK